MNPAVHVLEHIVLVLVHTVLVLEHTAFELEHTGHALGHILELKLHPDYCKVPETLVAGQQVAEL